jgi:hypothetical protein
MNETTDLGFSEAASRLGVTIGVLRRAIRTGKLPAPPRLSATASLPGAWFAAVQAAAAASPKVLSRGATQKVPPFARYEGTSAWRKYANRVREYARFCAAA